MFGFSAAAECATTNKVINCHDKYMLKDGVKRKSGREEEDVVLVVVVQDKKEIRANELVLRWHNRTLLVCVARNTLLQPPLPEQADGHSKSTTRKKKAALVSTFNTAWLYLPRANQSKVPHCR